MASELETAIIGDEIGGALARLTRVIGGTSARLVVLPEACPVADHDVAHEGPPLTITAARACTCLAEDSDRVLVAIPTDDAIHGTSAVVCSRCRLADGELLALVVGFADATVPANVDINMVAGLVVPLLMWAKHALELQILEAQPSAAFLSILKAQEDEREWLSYELHDRVAQTLASAFQQLQAAEGLARSAPDVRQLIVRGSMLCREAIREVRSIMNELRPAAIGDVGLVALVEDELRQLREDAGYRVDVHLNYDTPAPRDIELVVYRIFHEALINVRRHASAHRISVSLESDRADVRLVVEDDGVGFNLGETLAKRRVGGLMSMQRRAELLGGSCHLRSEPGKGTTVHLRIPWPRRRREDRHPRPAAEAAGVAESEARVG